MLPDHPNKIVAKWQGPLKVLRKVRPTNHEVEWLGHRKDIQVYHVNVLKKWEDQEGCFLDPREIESELGLDGAGLGAKSKGGPVTVRLEGGERTVRAISKRVW